MNHFSSGISSLCLRFCEIRKYKPQASDNENHFSNAWKFVEITTEEEEKATEVISAKKTRKGVQNERHYFCSAAFSVVFITATVNGSLLCTTTVQNSSSLQLPGLLPFVNTGKTFRNYLRHILFSLRVVAIELLIIVLARPQKTDKFQNVTTEGIDIILLWIFQEVC
jgi:hypothetical protein